MSFIMCSFLLFTGIIFIGCDAYNDNTIENNKDLTVTFSNIFGINAPVTGAAPSYNIIDNDQFTGTMYWDSEMDGDGNFS